MRVWYAAGMWKATGPLTMSAEQQKTLDAWVQAKTTAQRIVLRSRICLLAARGQSNNAIAGQLGVTRPTVLLWRRRFAEREPVGLSEDAPHGQSSRRTKEAVVKAIVEATLHTVPPGATHWSTRTMAEKFGVSNATVSRIWDAHGLQPHRVETFKLSKDKRFVEKLTDVVGVYLNPPDKAVVLCVDEKSQIQALNRTQPGLPLKKGRCGTMTHDYKRNGTTTLFAALDLLQGKVIGDCYKRHRHQEFLKFLRRIDREFPGKTPLHLVMDNYGTHGTPEVKAWMAKHPRFVAHYVPTSCSWLNLIERWFAELTNKRIRRGSFLSVDDLIAAIEEFLAAWNEHPKPFVWTATVDSILAKLARCRQTLEQIQPGCSLPKRRKRKSS